jgi:hypothetical protein
MGIAQVARRSLGVVWRFCVSITYPVRVAEFAFFSSTVAPAGSSVTVPDMVSPAAISPGKFARITPIGVWKTTEVKPPLDCVDAAIAGPCPVP